MPVSARAWRVRESVLQDEAWLGIQLDRTANRDSAPVISTDDSRVRVFVMPSDEEGVIARHAVGMLDRAIAEAAANR
jgi:acetate kinase